MEIKVTTTDQLQTGVKVIGMIDRTIVEGKIYRALKNKRSMYFCQDKKNGTSCGNRQGYKYSWVFTPRITGGVLKCGDGVKDLRIITDVSDDYDIY